jgi:membrane peptidoglycan carboxypeptidase
MDDLRRKYTPRRTALEERISRARAAHERQKQQASAATMQTVISVGTGILGALLGRKAISSANLGRATTAARGVGRSMKESSEVAAAAESVENLQAKLADLEAEFAIEAASLAAKEPVIETLTLKPKRGGITSLRVVHGWLPR